MEHANSSPMLLSILSLLQQLVDDDDSPTTLMNSTSVGGLSNLFSALDAPASEKVTETSTCDVSEAEMNVEENESQEKEKTPTFENIWASPEGSNGGIHVRKFPQLKAKTPMKVYRDEHTEVRMSEPTPTQANVPLNESRSDLVALWSSAVAKESPQNFENLWGGNRTENRVRKYASPQRQRTVINASKALLPVVHRNALSPAPAKRPTAPDLFSHQEEDLQEEEEIIVKLPKRTFEKTPLRSRNRTSTSVKPPVLASSIVSNSLLHTVSQILFHTHTANTLPPTNNNTLLPTNTYAQQATEEVISTTAIDSTDKSPSPRCPIDEPLSDSPIVSSDPIIPTEPKEPKSTQSLQKPTNPRRRLSEPLMDALSEI